MSDSYSDPQQQAGQGDGGRDGQRSRGNRGGGREGGGFRIRLRIHDSRLLSFLRARIRYVPILKARGLPLAIDLLSPCAIMPSG